MADKATVIKQPISEILGKTYNIPEYQRGYRWEEDQVNKLLDDLLEFYNKIFSKCSEEIYCLQPLVIKDNKGVFDVIDGQQRLTTLNILLTCLNETNNFSLQYASRPNSADFLKDIKKKSSIDAAQNADYFHMVGAMKIIKKWIAANKNIIDDGSFIQVLHNRVKFIQYKLGTNDDAIETFKRLNIGKISLTESELVKALLLNSNNFKSEQTDRKKMLTLAEMANEWDEIEYRLQDDKFWLFFHENGYRKNTRIDYILDLVRILDKGDITIEKNLAYPTLEYFEKRLSNTDRFDAVDKCWKEISEYFNVIEEWYNDDEIYHYIGYICSINKPENDKKEYSTWKYIIAFLNEYKKNNCTKDSFKQYLKEKITESIEDKTLDLTYSYEDKKHLSKTKAKPLLLLHNILTVLEQNKMLRESRYELSDFNRFPFHLYNRESWDVEHIRPNNVQTFSGEREKTDRMRFAYVNYMYYKNDTNKKKNIEDKYIDYKDKFVNGSVQDEINAFNILWEEIDKLDESELDDADKNRIWNYVLLDSHTNREYGNSCYAIKRDFVFEKQRGVKPVLEVDGKTGEMKKKDVSDISFVPVCTGKVFSKSYTVYPDNLSAWTEDDAKAYEDDLFRLLQKFGLNVSR